MQRYTIQAFQPKLLGIVKNIILLYNNSALYFPIPLIANQVNGRFYLASHRAQGEQL
jgi:hypothetical protein